MKKLVGFIGAWSLYWLGDLISRLIDFWPSEKFHPYFLYSKTMGLSCDIQDWAGNNTPWTKAENLRVKLH